MVTCIRTMTRIVFLSNEFVMQSVVTIHIHTQGQWNELKMGSGMYWK